MKRPWHDTVWLEFLGGYAIFLGLALAFFLLSECVTRPAHAELYLDLAGGATQFQITAADGDYIQRGLPHTIDQTSFAYRVGVGYRFNERWSVQGGYLNLGTINQTAQFVADADYNAKINQCVSNCVTAAPYRMTDKYHGGELTLTRTFTFDDYSLFLKGGGALLFHQFRIARYDGSQAHENDGKFPALVLGTGACYQWACAEVNYYHGMGGSNGFMGQDQGWPLSKEMLVSLLSVKIPIPH